MIIEKKERERHSLEEGEKRDGQTSDCQDDFQKWPFVSHIGGNPRQTPKESMYSLSLPDPHIFFYLWHTYTSLGMFAEKGWTKEGGKWMSERLTGENNKETDSIVYNSTAKDFLPPRESD